MRKVTVTPNGNAALQDVAPTEGNVKGVSGSINLTAASGAVSFVCSEKQFDDSVRPQLEALSQKRIPLVVNGVKKAQTQPLLTWSSERVPGGRPRVHLATGTVSHVSATNALVFFGENLIPGVAASLVIGSGTSALTLTAVRKGPSGNNLTVAIYPASGAGSVTTTLSGDGVVAIKVVPAAAGPGANAIAAQINADTTAALFVSAAGGGTGTVPARSTFLSLSGGSGAGTAWADIASAVAGSYLRVEAQRPGNDRNLITLTISAPSGGGSVTVSGTDITVVPAAASNTLTAIAAQLNGNASAKALVAASVVGAGASASVVTAKTYLAGGSGETPVVKVGGVVGAVTKWTDIEIDVTLDGTTLVASEIANAVLLLDAMVVTGGTFVTT